MVKKLAVRYEQVSNDTEALLAAGANELLVQAAGEPSEDSEAADAEPEPLVTEGAVKWVAATLLSRSFNLEIPLADLPSQAASNGASVSGTEGEAGDFVEMEAERILALVPWADTLNHCSTATDRSLLQYDLDNDAAVLFAHRDYAQGEEVFDSYGTWLTPSELLLDYGFVDADNRNFAIQVPAESIANAAAGSVNAQLLNALHVSFNGAPEMTLTETGIDDTLLSYMRASVAPQENLVEAGWATDWSAGSGDPNLPLDTMSRLVEPIDFNTEAKVLETLLSWCDRQLAGYSTALQNDLTEVKDESTPWLRVQVLRALISEKQTLVGLQKQLRDRMQQLKEGCPLEMLYE